MIRGPSVPRLKGGFLPILAIVALTRAAALASFVPVDHLGSLGRGTVFSYVLASFALGTIAWPLLAPFAERLREPRLRHWVVFWGAFLLSSSVASLLLNHYWLPTILGVDFIETQRWIVPMFALLPCVALGEFLQANADQAAARVAEARRLNEGIRTTHEIVRLAKEAEDRKLRIFLAARVERELRILRHEAASLLESAPADPARLIALQERIDVLREKDLRQASHLLHPHVPKTGLAPALASMARRVGDRMRISVELPDEVRDSLSSLSAPVCHAAYCLAEATLERAVDACGAHDASVRVEAPEVGPHVLAIAHDCYGCSDHIADSRFDLAVARMELTGGAVNEARGCEHALITMTLPAPEGTA